MVQAGVGPYPGAPGFPPAPTAVNPDTLSVAVAVKAEVSQLKPDGAPPPSTSAAQVFLHKKQTTSQTGGQFSPPMIGAPQTSIVPTSGPPTLPLPLPVSAGITNGIEQQTVSISDLLQQTEPETSAGQQTVVGIGGGGSGGGGGGGGGNVSSNNNVGIVTIPSNNISNTGLIISSSGISGSTTTTTSTINQIVAKSEPGAPSSTVVTGGGVGGVGLIGSCSTGNTLGLPSIASSTVASQTTSQVVACIGAGGILTSAVTTTPAASTLASALVPSEQKSQPKRLHVSNIPFRFRDPDLRAMFGQFGTILDVEIIFNERGSKGFGFVTFANSSDAERARERLHGTVVEGRKIEVNNATARVQTKKTPTVPNVCLTKEGAVAAPALVCVQWPEGYRLPVTWPLFGAVGTSAINPTAPAATQLAPTTPLVLAPRATQRRSVYYDPFLAAAAATADPNYRFQAAKPVTEVPAQPAILNATAPLLKTPLSTAQQAYTAAATYTAVAARAAYGAAAAAQPAVASYAAVAGYGREYADPYLGHGIGPVPGYGAAMYRGGYNRFTPY